MLPIVFSVNTDYQKSEEKQQHAWRDVIHSAKMNKMLAVVLLTIQMMMMMMMTMMSVTSATDSVQVVSFRKSRTTQTGPVMCALDTANKTISSSSLDDCSLGCAHDGSCTGFNIKDSHTCDLYNYKPKINLLVSDCTFYQVSTFYDITPSFTMTTEHNNILTELCCKTMK